MVTTISENYHMPVMVDEVMKGLAIVPTGHYADLTFGGGGHGRRIVESLSSGYLFAFDKDPEAAKMALLFRGKPFTFIRTSFRFVKEFINFYGIRQLDGLLADLGTSSHQIDTPERGFSTRFDGVLDMRMDPNVAHSAQRVVNTYSVEQLAYILHFYGEVVRSTAIAKAIIKARNRAPIATTYQLKAIIEPFAPKLKVNQYLAKVFQAFRIEVNDELGALERLLKHSVELIKPKGRLAIIAYHSLEDRFIKNFFNTGNVLGQVQKDAYGNLVRPFVPLQKKPFLPSIEEVGRNSRARSARLRVAVRVA
ncbi:16S rRNA (cytosine(1402)-N(4))-methyltransferase RsmH [Cardinium endosymbiont of Oedothorax gibbosus]|uniref:16S rRNA (cytosine(1402)-N(4))-methyltransferase RsmH n=1 Tax=Cardinium endosymbiont of Oedothorax gibbosus TaxID=931101 RepID=UPI00202518ED|nr:16S rRNA (cytosine(1402)-N(4))-methyltransferase RsmH [Cardinium endosymbiont of Oedothorax gibbosus]CAH2559776.1 Ribosomal RNA small subunit methyltransferase H [Cardinium endosymbiont of Oedothorax gibbosus]